jgi:hypothetical protein
VFYLRKWSWGVALVAVFVGLSGCVTKQPLSVAGPPPESGQFGLVSKDGIEIACPRYWHSDSDTDPDLVYCVSRSDYIRLTVAVLPALQHSYYEGLVTQGTVTEIALHGFPVYINEYKYPYDNHQMITKCITAVEGNNACHIMILCDVSLLGVFEPTFEYVLNSLSFLSMAQ